MVIRLIASLCQHARISSRIVRCALIWQGSSTLAWGWTPGTSQPAAAAGFAVNRQDRRDVLAFYHTVYGASQGYAARLAWTGSIVNGVPGTTSATFKEDVRRRINFYRALGGLPADITFDPVKSAKCQEAALMFARNGQLSHNPPANWVFFNSNAAQAAAASNLGLGSYGPDAIDAYMRDDGSNNIPVPHRRWIHFPRAQSMGTGDVPAQGTFLASNCQWVIGDWKPAPAAGFVSWPNAGFTPANLVPARWSLSYPGANFGNAVVVMRQGSTVVPCTIISRTDNGYGDNTLVWEPAAVIAANAADTTWQVTVSGISGQGVPASHSYQVTAFDPNQLGEEMLISGSPVVAAAWGGNYRFQPVAQADAYELQVSRAGTAAWLEGAEDPSSRIAGATTGTYVLRQSEVKRSGSKGFQLTFGTYQDQSFVIQRDIIPSVHSQLLFHERCRFATTTSTLQAEVSSDGGTQWTSVWSRNGVGLHSSLFDPNFNARSVSLAAFAGRTIRIRFILRHHGSTVASSSGLDSGFFIDDITVSQAVELVDTFTTVRTAGVNGFRFDAASAGAGLVAGASYHLRVRPNVGTRWFPYCPSLVVAVQSALGYSGWVASLHPAVVGGVRADHDGDGISNGVEYAFGLDPTVRNPAAAVPQPVISGQQVVLSYDVPPAVTGISYGAEWSTDLVQWQSWVPQVVGARRTYSVGIPATTGRRWFFRHRLVVQE